jgi:hypothetical protein
MLTETVSNTYIIFCSIRNGQYNRYGQCTVFMVILQNALQGMVEENAV